jgi:SAM-dependent methyltransferase
MLPFPGHTVDRNENAHREAERFFEAHWKRHDPWGFDTSPYEQARLDRLRDVVADRRYPRVLELGCGAGHLTERLLPLADSILALDISAAAVEKARARLSGSPRAARAEVRVANVMETDLRGEGAFDLVVLTETVYYLGWLYSFFKVAWLARDLFELTAPSGRLLLANTFGDIGDALVLPWIVRGYHDLFRAAGYGTEREETFRGEKDGVALEVLISLLRRA